MFKKIIFAVIIILMFALAGASNHDIIQHNYTFTGENDSWKAEYAADETEMFTESNNMLHYQNKMNDVLTVAYKNDISNLSSIKYLKITYETGAGSAGSLTENYDSGGGPRQIYKFKFAEKGGMPIKENAIITVTINLDGNVQIIELKNRAVS